MPYSLWDLFKDSLGTVGAILVVLPWLFDFRLRGRRERARRLHDLSGPLDDLRTKIIEALADVMERPRRRDFYLTLLGLCMLVASFAVGLIHGLIELFGTT